MRCAREPCLAEIAEEEPGGVVDGPVGEHLVASRVGCALASGAVCKGSADRTWWCKKSCASQPHCCQNSAYEAPQ